MDSSRVFSDSLQKCKDAAISNRELTQQQFWKCVSVALSSDSRRVHKKKCNCFCCFKVAWLFLLFFLAFVFVTAGVKPVAFLVHKAIHDKLYYILRPIRLSMVTVLPYLDQVGLDFLNTDCMLENPLFRGVQGCPCFRIKYPKEVTLNSSVWSNHVVESELLDVYVLRNITQFDEDFTLMNFVDFPSQNGGKYPHVCREMGAENSKIYHYDEFYHKDKIASLSNDTTSWTFFWEECPDETNPLTLHSIIPALNPPLNLTPNSTFAISTKWGRFSGLMESFPSGAAVIVRVLLGQVRFLMEPRQDECFGICTMFRRNPVLEQGDALLFDQRAWTYMGISWTDVSFVSTQLVSWA